LDTAYLLRRCLHPEKISGFQTSPANFLIIKNFFSRVQFAVNNYGTKSLSEQVNELLLRYIIH
ncbi:MAG: hypothetical protein ACRDEB_03905, partial [Chitinophagaceae bacterium]